MCDAQLRSRFADALRLASTCVVVLACTSAATAQLASLASARGVRVEAQLEKLVEAKKEESGARYELTRDAVSGVPGQFVLTLKFSNETGATIDGVRITSAIPEGLRYATASASGPGGLVLFSVDGGRTFASAQELATRPPVPDASGQPSPYTHVRWLLDAPLEAGASGFVRLRAESH